MKMIAGIFFLFISVNCFSQLNIDTASYRNSVKPFHLEDANSFVMIGEVHGIKNTYRTQFYIIKNLAALGYHKLFIESGTSESLILNEYMQTGADTLLHYTRAREGEYRQYIEAIYNLNKENNYHITFYGYDFERGPCIYFLFHRWFNNVNVEDGKLNTQLKELLSINEDDRNVSGKLEKVFIKVRSSFPQYEKFYQAILKEHFYDFKKIIFAPFFRAPLFGNPRNENMAKALLEWDDTVGLDKGILISGDYHIIYNTGAAAITANALRDKYSLTAFYFKDYNCLNYYTEGRKKNTITIHFSKKEIKQKKLNNDTTPRISFLFNNGFLPLTGDTKINIITIEMDNQL